MAITDIFPLTPYYPVEPQQRSRLVEQGVESGKVYKRSKGTDLWRCELQGTGSSADIQTLINFHAQMTTDVFTFEDKSFSSGQINRICVFRKRGADLSAIDYKNMSYEHWIWTALIEETTLA
jgi:hypothetical protein